MSLLQRILVALANLVFALVFGRALGAQGTLIVLNKAEASASLLDATTGAVVATLPTGTGPHEVAVSPDGRWALVANYGARDAGRTLTVLDVPARKVERTIDLGDYRRPHGVAWLSDGRRAAVTVEADGGVLLVDVAAGRVERLLPTRQRGSHMVAVAPAGRHAFVANIPDGSVTRVDLRGEDSAIVVPTGAGAEGIDVSPDGREVWVTNREDNTLTVLDAASMRALATIPTGAFPIRVKFTPDGRRVLVSAARAAELRVYDAAARREVAAVSLAASGPVRETMLGPVMGGAVPIGILVTPDGARAYVARAGADDVVVLDLTALEVVGTLVAGREPDGLGWSSAGTP
jgi:YVTN family beta-propeller protein